LHFAEQLTGSDPVALRKECSYGKVGKKLRSHRVASIALSSDERPADFRVGQLKFAISRLEMCMGVTMRGTLPRRARHSWCT
jgi:hypothetical protein